MMTKPYKNSLSKIAVFMMSVVFSASAFSLTELTEDEMGDISGQVSLLEIDRFDFAGNNFYQVKVNAEVEASVNIDHLLLNDSAGNAQVDITDLSIGGGINNQVSSATLTNPFVEFAFAGSIDSTNARNREIIGIRVGADELEGVVSFGTQNPTNANLDTGINTFSGFLKTNPLEGTANTLAVDRDGFNLDARLVVLGVFDGTLNIPNARVELPELSADFTTPSIVVNGTGQTDTFIQTDLITINDVDFIASGSSTVDVCLNPFGGCNTFFFPFDPITINPNVVASGEIDNIKAVGEIVQDLKTIHRVSINDGFYASAQNQPIRWRGADIDDIAQPGWWLGFQGEVQIDPLNLDAVALPDSTIQAILVEVTAELDNNPVQLGLGEVFDGFSGNVEQTVNVTLPNAMSEFPSGTQNPAILPLVNQQLGASQAPVVNCFNSSIGC